MVSVASQLIEEVAAHAQSDSLEDAQQICADGTYFPNNFRMYIVYCILIWTQQDQEVGQEIDGKVK
jgi:hypothetical protein